MITHEGQRKSLSQWAEDQGMSRSTLDMRLHKLGWTMEKALSVPVLQRPKPEDMKGVRFGRLTIIKAAYIPRLDRRRIYCRVKCDCGSPSKVVSYKTLQNGGTRSCGCLRREVARAKALSNLEESKRARAGGSRA